MGLLWLGRQAVFLLVIHVGSIIAALTSQAFLLIMMISGAVGFYLGIDTPPVPFHLYDETGVFKVDSAEFLSAVGTFLGALAAFVSVGLIVLREAAIRVDVL